MINAISLYNPYAMLIALGVKLNETRSWPTKYRGPLAIHASKRVTPFLNSLCFQEPFIKPLTDAGYIKGKEWVKPLPAGAVIAVCTLVDCRVITEPPEEPELSFGDFSPGRYAWKLENPIILPEPIPAKGMLGIWKWNIPKGAKICQGRKLI